jgi:hypothetical protein
LFQSETFLFDSIVSFNALDVISQELFAPVASYFYLWCLLENDIGRRAKRGIRLEHRLNEMTKFWTSRNRQVR